jgi:hypothetical protein
MPRFSALARKKRRLMGKAEGASPRTRCEYARRSCDGRPVTGLAPSLFYTSLTRGRPLPPAGLKTAYGGRNAAPRWTFSVLAHRLGPLV